MSSTYYACVNDAAAMRDEAVTFCGQPDSPEHQAVYNDRDAAIAARDRLRDESDNPDINVYQFTLEPVRGDA